MPRPDPVPPPVVVRRPAEIDNLAAFIAPVLGLAAAAQLDPERQNDLELALEESLVNICNHAYPDRPGEIELSCRLAADRLVILIVDTGIPFSLVEAAAADLSGDIEERPIGGLGVHLIKSLMDEVRSRRENGRNLLELVMYLPLRGQGQ